MIRVALTTVVIGGITLAIWHVSIAIEAVFVFRNIVRRIVRRGLKRVPGKASISLRVDAHVLEWFKAQGPGYQTKMNAVLRAFKDASV